ncbi:MAG: heat-inducible transcriptional repressor HrcA [Anaerolineaceae bacterium]|nr:heat-inducible transcriptional repressor HrcA [Anaerolineaceae bacterium]
MSNVLELTERQRYILSFIIHDYIKNVRPVGSKYLVNEFNLKLSSATVRNELALLDDLGLLRQPHTSAGRVPTEEGYRFFVGNLLQSTELPENTRHTITHQFYQMNYDVEDWMRLAASILAQQSSAASLVTAPHPQDAMLKHLELISTRGLQVLMILVLQGGEVDQQYITLKEPLPQGRLSQTAQYLTNRFAHANVETIQDEVAFLSGVERDIAELVLKEMQLVDRNVMGEVYLDGISHVLAEPEFVDSEDARQAIRALEERSILQDLMRSSLTGNAVGGVQVLIGGEGTRDELRQCSLILTQYGIPGTVTGMLGVVGPIRMPYGRSISTIRFLSSLLSNLVQEMMTEA